MAKAPWCHGGVLLERKKLENEVKYKTKKISTSGVGLSISWSIALFHKGAMLDFLIAV